MGNGFNGLVSKNMTRQKIAIFIGIAFMVLLLILVLIVKPSAPIQTTVPIVTNTFPTPTVVDIGSEAPVEQWTEALEQYKGSDPAFYLANFANYKSDTFSINYFYKTTPQGHPAFRIELYGTDRIQAKQEAINWIASQGLTQDQINILDIEYIGE